MSNASGLSETIARPLHVRVAEALGWTLIRQAGWARYVDGIIVEDNRTWWGRDPIRQDAPTYVSEIPPFDIDWGSTGPLIERLQLDVIYDDESDECGWVAQDRHKRGLGRTPLVAVCEAILALKEAGKL